MPLKAVALLSGGLDSSLAIRLVQDQGVEVTGLHFVSVFNGTAPERAGCLVALRAARQLGVPFQAVSITHEHLELVRAPRHGYGANLNPCIDCHILMLRRAAERMAALGARFLLTGEVLGQRPMSQRRSVLQRIDREAGLRGLVLRPLSARLLSPTVPESEGWVDRQRLLDLSGRSRKPQLQLARRYGITEHATPAGGCLLTEPGFAARLRDLLAVLPGGEPLDLYAVHLLKVGRHFRLDPATKAIVGRCERENGVITTFSRPADLLLTTRDAPGPTTLLSGDLAHEHVRAAAALTARYSKLRDQPAVAVTIRPGRAPEQATQRVVETPPIDDVAAASLRIA
ncbi:MAG: tRNA 4-thiouridine(8) synthase ThiI [Candidatus Brocadiia bacterium]